MNTGSYVNGKWYRPSSSGTTRNINPADTTDVIAEYPLATAAELRGQLTGLMDAINQRSLTTDLPAIISDRSSGPVNLVADLLLPISNPPTQAQVQAVVTKLNELLAALRRTDVNSPT